MSMVSVMTSSVASQHTSSITRVPGVFLYSDFINRESATILSEWIDSQPWNSSLSRRTQHYGYEYNYKSRGVDDKIGDLPVEFDSIVRHIKGLHPEFSPNQAIVNEYMPGQGIAAHIDSLKFGGVIASLSLGSRIEMEFKNRVSGEIVVIELPENSVVILSGEGRYEWTHEIKKRKSDGGKKRGRRVSVTFRTVE